MTEENMRKNWFFVTNVNGDIPNLLPSDPLIPCAFGGQFISHISSLVDKSIYHSYDPFPGSLALREAFSGLCKIAGALIFWCSCASSSSSSSSCFGVRGTFSDSVGIKSGKCMSFRQVKHITSCKYNLVGFSFSAKPRKKFVVQHNTSSFSIRHLFRKPEKLWAVPALSLAAAAVPPFDISNQNVLALPLESGVSSKKSCEVEFRGSAGVLAPDMNCRRHAAEPRTGIEFPTILSSTSAESTPCSSWEVLVGTGSKTMRVIKLKSLRVYAFGVYIHPFNVCQKLGPKYASIPYAELKTCNEFYKDLLREDIAMTVRLVVNCNGMKINTVRDAFEKSLRARLVKANPETDYECLRTFGSCFTQDIPLPVGTTIFFRRTVDGQLITESLRATTEQQSTAKPCDQNRFTYFDLRPYLIEPNIGVVLSPNPLLIADISPNSIVEGNQVGAVCSKDLCRAFFDMYIGDFPVSPQTKEEIGKNVARIMSGC